MMEQLDQYQFNGEWRFKLKLPEFSQLHSNYWFGSERQAEHRATLLNGYVPFHIHDERSYDPKPTPAQEATIAYLIANEKKVVFNCFYYCKNEINPFYAESCGDDEWIPSLKYMKNLGQLIGIYTIRILTEEKNGQAYFQIDCDYLGDEEHGLTIIFHQERLIGYSGIGDMTYECVYKDLGVQQDEIFKVMLANRDFGVNKIHRVLEPFGKFKPWQLEATKDYIGKLLRDKANKQLIEEIESNNWVINYQFPPLNKNLADLAANANNVEILGYLIDKGTDFSQSMIQCTNYYIKKEAIECLVKHGANVDEFIYQGVNAFHNELMNFANARRDQINYSGKDEKRLEKATESLAKHKANLEFFLSMGANPNCCDQQGNDYKQVLRKRYKEDYLIKNGILEQIEQVIQNKKKN